MTIRPNKKEDKMQFAVIGDLSKLIPYPFNLPTLLPVSHFTIDNGVPFQVNPAGYHPTAIAHYALAHWNEYLATNEEYHLEAFLTQAHWLVEHECRIGHNAGGWPIFFPHPTFPTRGPWLSALTQGCGISVLVRANELTHEEVFLEVARRAVRTFERDILDGGVRTPIGVDGIFFEEVALYPAAHLLNGFIFALFGLYDYVQLTGDSQIEKLIHQSLVTMHILLDEFDTGFWTRSDLLHRHLASPSNLALQAMLLEALAGYTGCEHCARLASRWKSYECQFGSRLRYLITSRWSDFSHALLERIRAVLFARPETLSLMRVCVPLPAFPFTGGVLTVLEGVAHVTRESWQLEYLTRAVGPHPEDFVIHRFGIPLMAPSVFPNVCFYVIAGFWKLISLLHHRSYHVILPQDGVFTAAFAALAAKLAGIRVVAVDHGNLTLLKSRIYRAERVRDLAARPWLLRYLYRLLLAFYLPFVYMLARISARFTDHFLVPGVAGDGVEEICKELGVPTSKITRFASMIDMERHVKLDTSSKANIREKNGMSADSIVVAIICRLAPEKGIDIALESISQTLSMLSPDLRARVRVIIAGDGPQRNQVEEDIRIGRLNQTCLLWGEISAKDVLTLLAISDIFLYTSTRGACFSMAVLEAMASGCAVIASTQPLSNSFLLAEGRGIAVPANDVEQMTMALLRLLNDPELSRRMGSLASDYIATQHSAAMFRRTLMRATYWSALEELLDGGKKVEATGAGSES